ncbi:MAG: hypothetical protein KKG06_04000 [Bacteroidetes bacterium]|nr:hypothetical protein [Bacteroidota bacterium]MBU1422335.1 hypothetical protein [Bacteroidota bacterium]
MQKIFKTVFLFILLTALHSNVFGGDSFEERLQKFGAGYAKGYSTPFATAFGAGLNSGIFHTADVSTGIDVYVGVKLMAALIPNSARTFDADLSDLNAVRGIAGAYPTPVTTATIFGGKGKTVGLITGPGDSLKLADGSDLKIVPFAVPHITIGNIFGTRAILRFFPSQKISDFGEFSFYGIGIQHDVSQYLIGVPFDWSAHIMYQSLKVKPLIESSAFSIGTEVSKTLTVLTVYGGIAYETSNMKFKYNWTPVIAGVPGQQKEVKFDLTGENTIRLTAGLSLKLLIFHISADYSVAKQPVATVGLGIAI